LASFLTNIQKPKVILGGKNSCTKNFQNSGKCFCVLNLVMQTRPGEQDFGLFDIYFGCNTFFVGHKGYFSTNSRFEKEGTIFNCKGFRTSSIFRIL